MDEFMELDMQIKSLKLKFSILGHIPGQLCSWKFLFYDKNVMVSYHIAKTHALRNSSILNMEIPLD